MSHKTKPLELAASHNLLSTDFYEVSIQKKFAIEYILLKAPKKKKITPKSTVVHINKVDDIVATKTDNMLNSILWQGNLKMRNLLTETSTTHITHE